MVTITKHINDAWNWWLTGLLHLLSVDLREKIRSTPDRLHININKSSIDLNLYRGFSNAHLESRSIALDDKLATVSLQEWLNELSDTETENILLVPDDKVLFKTLSLPASTKDNLREILGFEMDRQTPFNTEQVYFDYQQIASNNNEKIQLELHVVLRDVVDDLLTQLTEWHVPVHRITIMRNENLFHQINLIPEHLPHKPRKPPNRFTQVLAIACFLLFISALYLPLPKQDGALEELESTITIRRAQAKELFTLTAERESTLARSRFILDKQQNQIAMIDSINELTRILPDDTWLNRLVIRNNKMEIQGESTAATAIIEIVENSSYFRDVQFRSPVTRNNATGKDKFNVSANLALQGNS